jgi:NAD(P)-dependent dehydrogenase (short-subunit alcohol dehydrogenase family)
LDLNLNQKVVVVTGGGRGIGEAICMEFGKECANVVVSDIDLNNAIKVSEKLQDIGVKSIFNKTNVANKKEVYQLFSETIKEFGTFDILVNNAGISPKNEDGGPPAFWDIKTMDWNIVIEVNLNGSMFCSQEALKHMLEKKKGAIVNIASIAGKAPYEPMATGAHYDVTKAAIINLTQRLASEVADQGIRVNAVAPGRISTPLAKFASKEWNQAMLDRTLMRRFGTPEEVAKLVVFLASDAASYITGETVNINGGWLMD